jgi:23S rRNA (guanosine2251-2'-O)-methyltransferase
VYDPQNLGALMRAAECFGAAAMVWSRNRGCGLTPVVTKASVGASELLDLIEVSNLADAIRRFKDAGYWIVAADMDPQAEDLQTFQFPAHTVLVMGSEGSGLRELTRRSADSLVRIVTPGRIGSLNVSQATAVILHRIAQVWEASSI